MIVRIGLLKKKPDWDEARFREYWKFEHPKLAGRIPSLLLYQQNHTVERLVHPSGPPPGDEDIDGASYLWFESEEALKAGLVGGLGAELGADENHFIGDLRLMSAEAITEVEPPEPRTFSGVKLFTLVRRQDHLDEERFRTWWSNVHSRLAANLPGLRGYRRNLITARQAPRGTPCSHDQLPVDGVAEYWFDSREDVDAAFASAAGTTLLTAASDGIASDAVFIVEPFVVR